MFLAAAAAGALTGGSWMFGHFHDTKHGNSSQQVTNATIAQNNVQESYSSAVITQLQTCATPQASANIIDVNGNFININDISQVLNDKQTSVCMYQAASQQEIQDEMTAQLAAQAQANAQAPLNFDGSILGGLLGQFSVHSGPLLNSVNIDTSSIQKSVAYVAANAIQNCSVNQGGSVDESGNACFGASGNAICVQGNFNNVSNVSQTANLDQVTQCFYSADNNQTMTQNFTALMQDAASATTTSSFTLLGWLVWFALFFVVIGVLLLAGRWLWSAIGSSSASTSSPLQQLLNGAGPESEDDAMMMAA